MISIYVLYSHPFLIKSAVLPSPIHPFIMISTQCPDRPNLLNFPPFFFTYRLHLTACEDYMRCICHTLMAD